MCKLVHLGAQLYCTPVRPWSTAGRQTGHSPDGYVITGSAGVELELLGDLHIVKLSQHHNHVESHDGGTRDVQYAPRKWAKCTGTLMVMMVESQSSGEADPTHCGGPEVL